MEGNRHPGIAETTDRQFFALLRSGLWNEVPERAPFDGGVVWEALYRLSFAQTVGPLVTDGVNRLPKEYLPAEPEHLDPFLGDMMATAQRNRVLDSFIPKVFHALRGIPVVLVKGQSLAQDYPDPERRQPGDIDLLLPPSSYAAAKEILLPKATHVSKEDVQTLHQGMHFYSVEVELHGSISTLMSRKLDRQLAALLKEQFDGRSLPTVTIGGAEIPVPEANFNAVYIFVHFLQHYWSGGVGLRQFVDWTTFVSVHKRDIHPVILEQRLEELGLLNLWKVFTGFAQEYLGCPAEKLPLATRPKPRKNARIWRYVRRCGNFGKNQDRKRKKESYLVRKIHSLWRLVIADRLRHFPVFPKESIRFFFGAFGYGLQRLAKGE
ncbi:MAG: nucleotidyltransferase family protein [Bacteroidales bacterium]|nr:nucleotidyltransferase family protein [Bacteroidales bacterium]